jgi:8-amino-7-oxononanoate synthase
MYRDDFLNKKLDERIGANALRSLKLPDGKIDFCSNDYLGIVTNDLLRGRFGREETLYKHGSTGSRLLSGNYSLVEEVEKELTTFHKSEAALIFNSGYDANVGLLSSVPQKGDTIIYDQLSHASIRDGIRISFAQAYSFSHNDVNDLEKKLQQASGNIFIVTESVFSMDGDVCPLQAIITLCKKYNAHLIIDEAHAIGVIGENGEGLAQQLQLQDEIFARVYTFGKAVGCHGAVITGSKRLRDYIINFTRSFIYSTALPEIAVAAIQASYHTFPYLDNERSQLKKLRETFQSSNVAYEKIISDTPIQAIIVPGNEEVKKVALKLQQQGFDVRPILYPTVPKGKERLRIVLHAFNTEDQLQQLIKLLQ